MYYLLSIKNYRKIRGTLARNSLTIFLMLLVVSVICIYLLILQTNQILNGKMIQYHIPNRSINQTVLNINTSSSTFSNMELANDLLTIYDQQLSRLAAAPLLPTYQNHRLRFKLNIISIATQLYGRIDSFNGFNRYLQVVCFERFPNTTTSHKALSFNLNFTVKVIHIKLIRLILQNDPFATYFLLRSTMPKTNEHADTINIEVNRTFSTDAILSLKYQWTDLNMMNSLDWPQWPLQKPCVHSIEYQIRKNHRNYSTMDFPCLVTNSLTHLTSRQMFLAEQSAVLYWLDKQYDASILHPLLSKTKTRRLSPMELSLNSTICSLEFNKWISTYQQWHENITATISHSSMTFEQQRDRILELNIRFMLYEAPTTGTADRIVHLMTTYLIAILTKRLLVFDSKWPEFFDVMQSTLNYEQASIIPWYSHLNFLKANRSQNHSKSFTSRLHVTSFDNIDEHYDYDKEFPERILIVQGHMGRIVQMMISNISIYRTFLTDDLHMSPENMFGCLYHSLLIYRLAALVERTSEPISTSSRNKNLGHSSQQILQAILLPAFVPIGIQIRTEDNHKIYDISDKSQAAIREETIVVSFQNYISCARDLVVRNKEMLTRNGQLPVGFLLSNAAGVRQTFLKRWQLSPDCFHSFEQECYNRTDELSLLANPDSVYHIGRTTQGALAFQVAMFDIFLFSFCQTHIITTISGFGRIAVFASLRGRNIYSVFSVGSFLCRNDSHSTSLIDSAYNWSGI